MKTKKLSLHDFEAVPVNELLTVKGGTLALMHMPEDGQGGGVVGGCEGDADGFGGTYSMDEVVVYGASDPDRVWAVCALCDANENENILPRKNRTPLFNSLIQQSGHTSGCREEYRNTYQPR